MFQEIFQNSLFKMNIYVSGYSNKQIRWCNTTKSQKEHYESMHNSVNQNQDEQDIMLWLLQPEQQE